MYFFTFSLIEANVTRDEICTFSIVGVHVVKKKHDFLHFFWHFFHFPLHFTKQNMHDKFKKSAFFGILPYITQQKEFFSTFFLHFFDEKNFNLQFPPTL